MRESPPTEICCLFCAVPANAYIFIYILTNVGCLVANWKRKAFFFFRSKNSEFIQLEKRVSTPYKKTTRKERGVN